MAYNEEETRFHLIDPVLRQKGYDDPQRIRLETPAPVEPTGPKGRTDYLLCVQVGDMPRPLPIAVLEAKRSDADPLKGIVSLPGGVFSTAGAGVKTNLLFFTKGKKTEHIWYYDLSWVKLGKKTPLTLAHFGFDKDGDVLADDALPAILTADWQADEANTGKSFPSHARMLQHHGQADGASRYSWTVDFAALRAKARKDMQPLLDKAADIKAAVVNLKERFKQPRKDKADEKQIEILEADIRGQEKAARDLEAEAAAIDAAVFDLKAVNPNAVAVVDERTPGEIIQSITAQGRIVADALARLNQLMAAPEAQA